MPRGDAMCCGVSKLFNDAVFVPSGHTRSLILFSIQLTRLLY